MEHLGVFIGSTGDTCVVQTLRVFVPLLMSVVTTLCKYLNVPATI